MNGIQEVSGSIPLISTRRIMKGLISSEIKPFCFPKKEYRDDAGSFHRHSIILPPTDKGRFHVQKIVKAAFFRCPEICLTVKQVLLFLVNVLCNDILQSLRLPRYIAILSRTNILNVAIILRTGEKLPGFLVIW